MTAFKENVLLAQSLVKNKPLTLPMQNTIAVAIFNQIAWFHEQLNKDHCVGRMKSLAGFREIWIYVPVPRTCKTKSLRWRATTQYVKYGAQQMQQTSPTNWGTTCSRAISNEDCVCAPNQLVDIKIHVWLGSFKTDLKKIEICKSDGVLTSHP